MRILVTSYFFHPEGTPRATRTFELVREFARRGHEVEAYVPDYPAEYSDLEARWGFRVRKVPSGFFLNAGDKAPDSPAARALSRPSTLKRRLYRAYHWATGGRQVEYARTLYRALKEDFGRDAGRFDLVLSIGLPFAVHLGTAAWLRGAGDRSGTGRPTAAADYGDPYYYDPMERKLFLHRPLEARVLKAFDYVTIPHNRIRDCFTPYRGVEPKLRIIPQGFDLEGVERLPYRPHAAPEFAYAGVFYPGHGDPSELLTALAASDREFRFVVYTDIRPGSESMACLAPHRDRLGDRLELRARIPRAELIRELSAMDFLVSIDWPGVLHTKLIDYRLAGRPILSYEPGRFEAGVLEEFLSGDYRRDFSGAIDLSAYDIRTVAGRFLDLAGEGSR